MISHYYHEFVIKAINIDIIVITVIDVMVIMAITVVITFEVIVFNLKSLAVN